VRTSSSVSVSAGASVFMAALYSNRRAAPRRAVP